MNPFYVLKLVQRRLKIWRLRKIIKIGSASVIYDEASIGSDSHISPSIVIGNSCHIKGELRTVGGLGIITLGDSVFVGPNTRVWAWRHLKIGNRVLISHNVTIFDSLTHPINARARAEQFASIISSGHPKDIDLGSVDVVLNDDIWVGCNSVITKGVVIGRGAIVGASSVVTKSVPAWAIVAGSPAKIIRYVPEADRF